MFGVERDGASLYFDTVRLTLWRASECSLPMEAARNRTRQNLLAVKSRTTHLQSIEEVSTINLDFSLSRNQRISALHPFLYPQLPVIAVMFLLVFFSFFRVSVQWKTSRYLLQRTISVMSSSTVGRPHLVWNWKPSVRRRNGFLSEALPVYSIRRKNRVFFMKKKRITFNMSATLPAPRL